MESAERIVRALSMEGGVSGAVDDGRRAVELTEAGLDELVTGALCGYARALYFAGELGEARAVALRVLEHPDIGHRVPSLIHAQATLALVAAGEQRLSLARAHAEHARNAVGRLGTSRSWLGAHVSAAMGVVLAAEEELTEAERELATAERFFRDEVPTVHHAWLLVLIAGVRTRRGRLEQAAKALRLAQEELVELPDAGVLPGLVAEVEQELARASERASTGAVLEAPTRSRARRAAAAGHRPLDTRDRRAALPLGEHGSLAPRSPVPEARRPLARRCDRPCDGARPAGRSGITWVIRPRS